MCNAEFRLQDKLHAGKVYIATNAIINRNFSRPIIKSRMRHAIKHDSLRCPVRIWGLRRRMKYRSASFANQYGRLQEVAPIGARSVVGYRSGEAKQNFVPQDFF